MSTVIGIAYLIAAVTFIFGLRLLGSPVTGRNGNRIAAAGMTLAIVATLVSPVATHVHPKAVNWIIIFVAMAIGGSIGVFSAQKVLMTAMPQMVAIFNGMGGGAAALVASLELIHLTHGSSLGSHGGELATIMLGSAIGTVSFAGSIVAFAKLQELVGGNAIRIPFQPVVVIAMLLALVGVGVVGSAVTASYYVFAILIALAILLGLLLVVPIGGADMPVVISLMNSMTGVAAALTGFVISNELLIVAGALVGASGTLLTQLMAKAMNRPLTNVLFGAFGAAPAGGPAIEGPTGPVKEISVDDAAMLMSYASQVIIVPGYGLAVAQAQHQVHELGALLENKGVNIKYAIHPVAGRMPGHMNVLLAEADVPYSELFDMDQVNGEFDHTDVALVVGANDVTNPAARNDPSSPIYGMPILNVDQAQHIIVMKRSMRPGFAGIDNPLYLDPKTTMLFGDAKDSLTKLVNAVKAAP
ncbi:MAG TPA: NAD(P)(+) transhydrogenase (Re/Si-specific) subunit beta [Chloroflexota bacterium]|jgi:NAD(P) transhydrogenase subunit beta|nr:NAD(P)(+) transhydrogenase (Re/Si-specific) subunit beta [Chloroflexota bacterium]